MRAPVPLLPPLLGLLPLLAGCGRDSSGAEPERLALADVVSARLAELDAELGPEAPLPDLDPQLVEEVDGMLTMLARAEGRMREVPVATVRDIGPAAIPRLVLGLSDGQRSPQERVAAAQLLGALDHPVAAEVLMVQVEVSREDWLRSWCAWHLSATSQDQLVPRLVTRLKSERDHATFVQLATTLAHFRNYAGLDGLVDLTTRGASEALRAQAATQLATIAEQAGFDARELARLWHSIEADLLPQPAPSSALRREVWRLVRELDGEHYQLGPIDDVRYALSHMGSWAALEIAPALGDRDRYVRTHVSQVLARMGPRAHATGPALLRALAEPGLAPDAADALGLVGHPPAIAALELRTGADHPHELRVAAVRALGRIGLPQGLAAVRGCFDDPTQPYDLRMAAATALVLLGEGDRAALWLAGELVGGGDPDGAEIALETWLVRGAEESRAGFAQALEAWRGEAGPPGVIPTLQEVEARRRARAAGLTQRLDALLE